MGPFRKKGKNRRSDWEEFDKEDYTQAGDEKIDDIEHEGPIGSGSKLATLDGTQGVLDEADDDPKDEDPDW